MKGIDSEKPFVYLPFKIAQAEGTGDLGRVEKRLFVAGVFHDEGFVNRQGPGRMPVVCEPLRLFFEEDRPADALSTEGFAAFPFRAAGGRVCLALTRCGKCGIVGFHCERRSFGPHGGTGHFPAGNGVCGIKPDDLSVEGYGFIVALRPGEAAREADKYLRVIGKPGGKVFVKPDRSVVLLIGAEGLGEGDGRGKEGFVTAEGLFQTFDGLGEKAVREIQVGPV
ncbi:MAG: hypothetical protein CVU63_24025 [Deltaproteobacteria bacterium HGW-Deltaproteobacteria-20]|nr:MAG: hypothetical protein CVU63_24025 [Deltaproteobacteria bacterium HGW-Deltaproteobacteria-20]